MEMCQLKTGTHVMLLEMSETLLNMENTFTKSEQA